MREVYNTDFPAARTFRNVPSPRRLCAIAFPPLSRIVPFIFYPFPPSIPSLRNTMTLPISRIPLCAQIGGWHLLRLLWRGSSGYNASMKKCYAYVLLAAAAAALPAEANEEAMKAAFSRWDQEMSEYQAAISSAASDEARAAVQAPDGKEVGQALWKAISGKTGTRKKVIKGTKGPALETIEDRVITVPTYEFEEKWAAPAVVWFIERPQVLAEIFSGKPARLESFAEALIDSVQEHHYDSPLMAKICHIIAAKPDIQRYELLKKIYLRNPDRNARGCAALGMSILLSNPMVSSAEGSEAMAMNKRLYYLKQALTLTDDNTTFGNSSLSEAASNQTYIIRHLTKGQTPPLVTMSDVDGQKANFPVKGAPAVLFFWHPSERVGTDIVSKHLSLKKQFPALQFLPITAHPLDDARLREDLKALDIPHTYIDDEEGSISLAYRISMLPMAVFTGSDGEIIYIGYPDIKLQTALDTYFKHHPSQAHPQPQSNNPSSSAGSSEEVLIQPSSRPSAISASPSPAGAHWQDSSPSSPESQSANTKRGAAAAQASPAAQNSAAQTPQASPADSSPTESTSNDSSRKTDEPVAPPPLRPMPSF